jgi:hypothetical protein
MNINLGIVGGIAASAIFCSASLAEVTATNAYSILEAVHEFGYTATMEKDSDGDPKISGKVSSTNFNVYFYGCTDNTDCKSLIFKAGYNLSDGMSASDINEWNRNKRFSRAYIDDEGDPFLEMDVNLDYDGVGSKNFQDTLDWWRVSVESFEEFIDW